MTHRLSDLTLRHVDPSKLFFQQRHPALPVPTPEWYERAISGGINLAPWIKRTVLATLETKIERPAYFAVVAVMGLFMAEESAAVQEGESSNQVDASILTEATEEEVDLFVRRAVTDLYPFLRSEVYALTGRLQTVQGVMLQPNPFLHSSPERPDSEKHKIQNNIRRLAHSLGYTIAYNIATYSDSYEREGRKVVVAYNHDRDQVLRVEASSGTYTPTAEGAVAALNDQNLDGVSTV